MHAHTRLGALVLTIMFVTAAGAAPGDVTGPARRSAIAWLNEPTLIGRTIVEGPVLFVHDEGTMARGEPCTTIRLFDPKKGPGEVLVSFRCIPRSRRPVTKFTITTVPNVELGFGCILTEYQFPADTEGHGVPAFDPIPAGVQ